MHYDWGWRRKEAGNGDGQNGLGHLTCTEPSLTTAFELNPSVCVLAVFEPQVDEEVVRLIAAQLAEIGDQFDKEIKTRLVNDLVQQFLNENLPGEVSEKGE